MIYFSAGSRSMECYCREVALYMAILELGVLERPDIVINSDIKLLRLLIRNS